MIHDIVENRAFDIDGVGTDSCVWKTRESAGHPLAWLHANRCFLDADSGAVGKVINMS